MNNFQSQQPSEKSRSNDFISKQEIYEKLGFQKLEHIEETRLLAYNVDGFQPRNKSEIRDELIQSVEKEIEKLRRKRIQYQVIYYLSL